MHVANISVQPYVVVSPGAIDMIFDTCDEKR
jgi:hypothetical protein